MSKEPEKIFKSLDFTSISEKSLIPLLQNDNLKMMKFKYGSMFLNVLPEDLREDLTKYYLNNPDKPSILRGVNDNQISKWINKLDTSQDNTS
ncbi:hypothetical protein C1645_821929 [Glomus cerebriforme]|uniref:Uncharacterized protein n=1 Tax=Glomus cerebriforme TaxID=658196 RepID=A0A397SZM4_9GLOM|nr:hypothetical protein C1645_821929 [Glomus cerebriforme]